MGPALFTRENTPVWLQSPRPGVLQWGPRCSRGKTSGSAPFRRRTPCFNGARVVHAGKPQPRFGKSAAMSSLQWGPRCSRGKTNDTNVWSICLGVLQWGPRCSRGKTPGSGVVTGTTPSFNGARVVHAGKPAINRARKGLNEWLQWGPRCSRGKTSIVRLFGRVFDLADASMGPALFTRENASKQTNITVVGQLQWGPRCSRGKTSAHYRDECVRRGASMGPALFTRENLPWSCPFRSLHSFNGARVVHAGKLCNDYLSA